ncbi:hypothetical protein EYF80_064784 [Liparis tanakae]|uniref:Uncharacterized protein n=1 Tax=Liparis tanakae TaxID=230148 RepID=A0A4Z2E8F9_9TELE|nr:hypothetical protein EYF80_064784 [Liparis tanakae]
MAPPDHNNSHNAPRGSGDESGRVPVLKGQRPLHAALRGVGLRGAVRGAEPALTPDRVSETPL